MCVDVPVCVFVCVRAKSDGKLFILFSFYESEQLHIELETGRR